MILCKLRDMSPLTYIFVVILLKLFIQSGAALTCFHCDQVPFPRDCKTVVKCGDHEECYTERIITDDGNVYFNTGCKDKQKCILAGKRSADSALVRRQASFETVVCDSCCSDDHCNYGGCGADPLPPADQRGPICYDCGQMRDPTKCNTVTLCGRDQLCEVLKTPDPLFDVTYTAKCGTKTLCERLMGASSIFGKRDENAIEKRSSLCFRCCKGDLCNLGCTSPTTVATTMVTTTMASTTTRLSTSTTMSSSQATTGTSLNTSPSSTVMSSSSQSSSTTPMTTSTTAGSSPVSTSPTSTSMMSSTLPQPTFPTNASNHGCLPDYVYYGSSCYYFSTTSLYWAPAEKFCKDHGSDLAIINDAQEDNLIVQHLKQLTAQHVLPTDLWGFYIGGRLVNGTWMWVDNTPVSYANWATSEPDHNDSQPYASIYVPSSGYYNYEWASHKDMYTTQYFICEFKPSP